MSVFTPTLETQIGYEQPVQAPRVYNPIGDIADTASAFLKSSVRTSGSDSDRAALSQFNIEMQRIKDLKESGAISSSKAQNEVNNLVAQLKQTGIKNIPEYVKNDVSAVGGVDFDALSYDNEEDYNNDQILSTDAARSILKGVKLQNPAFTNEQAEEEVLKILGQTQLFNAQVELQNARAAAGLPVESTPIVESIQNDFLLLSNKVAEYQADGIVTRDEFLSATTSVRALVATKYANFNNNEEVKAIQTQMFGLLDDIGKGVSTDPLDVQLDAVQIALQKGGFNPATIATVRSLVKTNPQAFKDILETQLQGEKGKTFVDALVDIWNAPTQDTKLEDIFGTRPKTSTEDTGTNPVLLSIPNVEGNPEAYTSVVANFSKITATTDAKGVLENEEKRNAWLNTMNIVSSVIVSQSDPDVLSGGMLNDFASTTMIPILESVYNTDPINAAQTNDAIQNALSAERIRQSNLLNSKLSARTTPEGQNIMVDPETNRLVLNIDAFRERFKNVPQGTRRLVQLLEVNKTIEELGGLEAFFALPDSRRSEILGGSNFENLFMANMGEVFHLAKNMKVIDQKLEGLQALEERYSSATNAFKSSITGPESLEVVRNALSEPEATEPEKPFVISGDLSLDEQKTAYDNLPSGALFVDPSDGKTYRKP